jgi:4-hydroxy-tetrahydrodipicolinate synthase
MFRGSLVALVTPFTTAGEIDEKALENLVEWHIQEGTDGIVCTGTTGEAPTLSDEEKIRVISICKKVAKNKTLVIAGTGTYDTKKSVKLTQKAKELGVDGCLVVVPYYNRPTAAGCIAHYQEIAKVGSPIIVYHHPGRTGISLSPETFSLLEKIPNIVSIKEASCSLDVVNAIQAKCTLPILSGDDGLTAAIMELGGVGVISVVANVIPKFWYKLTKYGLEKNYAEAKAMIKEKEELIKTLFLETNPQCVKYALHLMGKCSPCMRLPLLEPSESVKQKIKDVLQKENLI